MCIVCVSDTHHMMCVNCSFARWKRTHTHTHLFECTRMVSPKYKNLTVLVCSWGVVLYHALEKGYDATEKTPSQV